MKNNFSENLKKIRKENNLSQEQLAESLGVSRQAISKWESASAYPEMDKIIALCDKFNLNIDDLLNKDIKEIKREEIAKKNLNKYVDDFLNFITNTINMFSAMNFKSKMRCLFEQAIIIFILFMASILIGSIGNEIIFSFYNILPEKAFYVIKNILDCIYTVVCLLISLMILIHIFKTRYLNYYEDVKSHLDEKIEFDEEKIIIRDPKHSEYRIISGIGDVIIGIFKFFALCVAFFFFGALAFFVFCFVLSFLLYKTGIFFIGLLILFLSLSLFFVICILFILNFVFSRKNDKKKMIWGVIISVILIGASVAFISIGSLSFNYIANDEKMLKIGTNEYEMNDRLYFSLFTSGNDYEYVESDNTNVKVEYTINKYCSVATGQSDDGGVQMWSECSEPIKMFNAFVENLNNKKIISLDGSVKSMKIYTTKENIEKLKKNEEAY